MSAQDQGELLLVGVGFMGRPYAAAARRLGLRVRAVETQHWTGAIAHLVDSVEPSLGQYGSLDELWAETVHAAVVKSRPTGIFGFTESHVLGAALAQDHFGLPGPSLQAAVISRNKALQRGRFAAHGIGQPAYRLTDDLASTAEWAATHFPVVVKPLSSAGSVGVELVAGADAFEAAAAPSLCHLKNSGLQRKFKTRFAAYSCNGFDVHPTIPATRWLAKPIMPYSAVHTGPKIQFGGVLRASGDVVSKVFTGALVCNFRNNIPGGFSDGGIPALHVVTHADSNGRPDAQRRDHGSHKG